MDAARKLIAELAQIDADAFGAETLLSDVPGWDSLRAVQLVLKLESAIGRELSENEIVGLESVGDVALLMTSR